MELCGSYTYSVPGLRATITVYARTVDECNIARRIAETAKRDPRGAVEEARRLAAGRGGCIYRLDGDTLHVSTRDGSIVVNVKVEGPLASLVLNAVVERLSLECSPG